MEEETATQRSSVTCSCTSLTWIQCQAIQFSIHLNFVPFILASLNLLTTCSLPFLLRMTIRTIEFCEYGEDKHKDIGHTLQCIDCTLDVHWTIHLIYTIHWQTLDCTLDTHWCTLDVHWTYTGLCTGHKLEYIFHCALDIRWTYTTLCTIHWTVYWPYSGMYLALLTGVYSALYTRLHTRCTLVCPGLYSDLYTVHRPVYWTNTGMYTGLCSWTVH